MIRYHAAWVVPVSAEPIRDGTVAVDDGRIVYVGPRSAAPDGDDGDLGEVILCPGLVNVHTHLELTVMRGFLEGLEFRDWIVQLTTAKRTVLSRDDLLDSARVGVEEAIRAGVTTLADTCDSGVAFDAMIEAGVRGVMYQEVFGPEPAQCEASMAELREKVNGFRARETSLVRVGISPHAPYTVSDALFNAVTAYARTAGLPVAVHIAESQAESDLVERGDGVFAPGLRKRGIRVAPRARSPMALLDATGLLEARPLLIHAVRADAEDVALVRRHDAAVAHCPVSNARLGHGIAPAAAYRAAGVRMGLGSDSVASNNRMDLLHEAHAAVLMHGVATRSAPALRADEALRLATLGGAEALGLAAETGSLDVGKAADLAAFRIDTPAGTPVQDPAATLVHSLNGRDATFTCVAGRVLLRDGRLLNPDADASARVRDTAERLRRWRAEVAARGGVGVPASPTR